MKKTKIVVARGGFAGAETAGALDDFVRETAKFYPRLGDEEIRAVIIHPGDYLLPELGEDLDRYAERKMRERCSRHNSRIPRKTDAATSCSRSTSKRQQR